MLFKAFSMLIFLFSAQIGQSQNDSLWSIWRSDTQADSNRVQAMYLISKSHLSTQTDSARLYANMALELAKKIEDSNMMGTMLNVIGVTHYNKSEFDKALEFYHKSLEIKKAVGDKKGMSFALNNMGNIYMEQGDFRRAIINYSGSYKISEELGNSVKIARDLNNIGLVYMEQNMLEEAEDYFRRSLEISREIDYKRGISFASNNLGMIYDEQGDYEKAIEFYTMSADMDRESEAFLGLMPSLNNLGSVYAQLKKWDVALDSYNECLRVARQLQNKYYESMALNNIGGMYVQRQNYSTAIDFSGKALVIAEGIGSLDIIRAALENLYLCYEALGKYKLSLEYFTRYVVVRDSLLNEENKKELIRQEFKYVYDKKAAADSIKASEAKRVTDAQLAEQKAKLDHERTIRLVLWIGVLLLISIAIYIFSRYRKSQEQKRIIQEQKDIVEHQHEEIQASIDYAKRIQKAILPPLRWVGRNVESFVYYRPKDVVAGDFYWFIAKDGFLYFAAADCTGHGVPGAMLSVVCNNALNRVVNEMKISEPAEILNKVRELVVKTFEESDEEVKDGMDISFGKFNLESKELIFSGANNPVYIVTNLNGDEEDKVVSNESHKIIEIKGDKQPIGKYAIQKPFNQHKIQLKKGDFIYMSSDGYPDQFGGPKGKKFLYKPFKRLLLSIHTETVDEQKEILEKTLVDWMGDAKQIDDVCILGLRV